MGEEEDEDDPRKMSVEH